MTPTDGGDFRDFYHNYLCLLWIDKTRAKDKTYIRIYECRCDERLQTKTKEFTEFQQWLIHLDTHTCEYRPYSLVPTPKFGGCEASAIPDEGFYFFIQAERTNGENKKHVSEVPQSPSKKFNSRARAKEGVWGKEK